VRDAGLRLFILGLICLCAFILPPRAALTASAVSGGAARPLHYRLVMSADDAICKPMVGLYETYLQDLFARGHAADALHITDFEATHPEGFARFGYIPIASSDTPTDPDLIVKQYALDLFNEGKPRIVVITDKIGTDYRSSELAVLKAGAGYRRVAVLNEWQPGIIDWYIDPQIIAEIPRPAPMIDGVVSIRPFRIKGDIYFVENQYARLPMREPRNSVVLVYRLLPTGRDNTCHIALAPDN
jgi:hypothetical protein